MNHVRYAVTVSYEVLFISSCSDLSMRLRMNPQRFKEQTITLSLRKHFVILVHTYYLTKEEILL